METLEVYFLVLVCGAFGVFALGMAMGTIREKAYSRSLSARNIKPHH